MPVKSIIESRGRPRHRREGAVKFDLCTASYFVLRKNCEPPLLGAPVLAIEMVPTSFEISPNNSSGMLPPPSRFTMVPSGSANSVFPGGPPVPAMGDWGFAEFGQPNWHMKLGITRWNVRPS